MEKNKKELLKKYKEEQRKKFVESLPMSIENFTDLFDYLDENMDKCDDELSLTRQFLMENNLPINEVIEWLETNGGYCDCEVLANIEDLFEEVI
ncbi:MAG: DUF2695 domain-containing protein [Lachnospiraceae bacterium]|nr:DUF2695 domain-containing protein [Lachnospiraceae bacterium]